MATDKKPKITGNAVRSAFRDRAESKAQQDTHFMQAISHPGARRNRSGPRKKSTAGPVKGILRTEPRSSA